MEQYKQEFIELLIRKGALQFGEFTLKSGRKSPYFINTGMLNDGEGFSELGKFYASAIMDQVGADNFDVIFGPAYKGIPLADTTVVALWRDHQVSKYASSDRKEEKDHADKGAFIGHKPEDGEKLLIIDDVFTTGQTKEDAVSLLEKHAKVEFAGVIIAVNRMEIGADGKSAIKEFTVQYKMPVYSIVTVREIIEHLHGREIDGEVRLDDAKKDRMERYLAQYGVK